MEILESAKKLGEMIKETGIYDKLMDAQNKVVGNEEAKNLLEQYDRVRSEYGVAVNNKNQENIDSLTNEITSLEKNIQENSLTNDFMNISGEYGKLISDINANISFGITGKEPNGGCGCGSEGSCGDSSCEPESCDTEGCGCS